MVLSHFFTSGKGVIKMKMTKAERRRVRERYGPEWDQRKKTKSQMPVIVNNSTSERTGYEKNNPPKKN